MKRMSHSMSSSVMARPRRQSNSWRLTPRNTRRLPLSLRMPSSMATCRKPMRVRAVSRTLPSASSRVTDSSYRSGRSALHGAASSISASACSVPSAFVVVRQTMVPFLSHSAKSAVAAFAAPSISTSSESEPLDVARSQSASAWRSATWAAGLALSSTERNRPCRRQKS